MAVSANILVITDQSNDLIMQSLHEMDFATAEISVDKISADPSFAASYDIAILHIPEMTDIATALADKLVSFQVPLLIVGENHRPAEIQSISSDLSPLELKRRLYSLHRVNIMEQEYKRRVKTSSLYGLEIEQEARVFETLEDRKVMLLSNDSAVLGEMLLNLEKKTNVQVCDNSELAIDQLRDHSFDALIIHGAGQGDTNFRLCTDIRADSRLFNLPVIFLLSNPNNREAAYIHGASDIVLYPDEMNQLAARLSLHANQTDYRFQLQQLFRASKPLAVTDGLTGLYSYGFVQTHLTHMIKDFIATDRHLTFAVIELENLEEINKEFGFNAGDQVLRQMGNILSFLVRGEDFCGRFSGDKFIIALPNTSIEAAGIALNRIYGVTRNTEYAIHGMDDPIHAVIKMGCAQLKPDETLKEIEKRAKKEGFHG